MIRLSLIWTSCLFMFPLLIAQAYWSRLRAPKLPEARPPNFGQFNCGQAEYFQSSFDQSDYSQSETRRSNIAQLKNRKLEAVETGGDNSPLKFLGIGDSVISGVGCEHLSEAITAQIAQAASQLTDLTTEWHAFGCNGDRIEDVIKKITHIPDPISPDFIIISAGVNDVTRLTSLLRWQLLVTRLIAELREKYKCCIVLLGLPPMQRFTALPQPLRFTLGIRAAMLDLSFKRIGDLLEDVLWIASDFNDARKENMLAEDGYHPSPLACRGWAQHCIDKMGIK